MTDRDPALNRKEKGERRIRWAARLLAAAACCVFLTFTAYGQETTGESGLEGGRILLDAVYGYQNMAKSGRFLPIKVNLENREEGSFSGTLCVLTMESDYTIYRYEYPVELEEGQKEERDLSISLGGQIDQMYLKVLDEEGQEIASKRLKLDVEEGTAQLFIGVLSDSMDKLGYLNNVGVSYSTLRTRTIELTPQMIPSDGLGLDQLDVLLISDFDTSRLSVSQVEAIWEWVGRGGVLLFGTGAHGEEVMNAFGDEILESPLPDAEERDINMGVEFAQDSPASATIPLTCTDVYLNGAKEILSSDEVTVLSAAQAGSGLVAAGVYDFGVLPGEHHLCGPDVYCSVGGKPDSEHCPSFRRDHIGTVLGGSEPDQYGGCGTSAGCGAVHHCGCCLCDLSGAGALLFLKASGAAPVLLSRRAASGPGWNRLYGRDEHLHPFFRSLFYLCLHHRCRSGRGIGNDLHQYACSQQAPVPGLPESGIPGVPHYPECLL